jgi:hypothetical protein
MKKLILMIALGAFTFGSIYAHSTPVRAKSSMQTDTTKKKKSSKRDSTRKKKDTTLVKQN